MLAVVLGAVVGAQSAEVEQFERAFRTITIQEATPVPDQPVVNSLEALIKGVAPAEDAETALVPFQKAVEKKDALPSDFSSLSAFVDRGQDTTTVGVRLGRVSRMAVFHPNGRAQVPAELEWSLGYELQPMINEQRLILVHAPSIQDAGVRYTYKMYFLVPDVGNYRQVKDYKGSWILQEDGAVGLYWEGDQVRARSLDEPRSFHVSNAEPIFRREAIFRFSPAGATFLGYKFMDQELRVVDAWLAGAQKATRPTRAQGVAKRVMPRPTFILDQSVTHPRLNEAVVKITVDEGKALSFTLRKDKNGYKVRDCRATQ